MSNKFDPKWITNGIDEEAVKYAESFGRRLADRNNGITTSQFRNFYGEIKRIQMQGIETQKNRSAFLLLRPKLAYAIARQQKTFSSGVKEFGSTISEALQTVRTSGDNFTADFDNFCDLMEALLAFHKFFGGRD